MRVDSEGQLNIKFSQEIKDIEDLSYFKDEQNPVIEIKLKRGGEVMKDLLIDWQLINVTSTELNVELDWDDYRLISTETNLDRLEVTFVLNGMFISKESQKPIEY